MLTRTLCLLEHDGLVSRTVCPTSPPQVEYDLTRWTTRWLGRWTRTRPGRCRTATGVQAARHAYDAELGLLQRGSSRTAP